MPRSGPVTVVCFMGLDVSHNAFSGAYSAFNRLRQFVCKAAGGSFPPHEDGQLDRSRFYLPDGCTREAHPGLYEFLEHSDCDGVISPEACVLVADELEAMLPTLAELSIVSLVGGHIERDGGYVSVIRRFIAGCRAAAAAGEELDFH